MIAIIIKTAVLIGLFSAPCFSIGPDAGPTADDIVRKANYAALYQGVDSKGKVSMTITDGQGRQRNRAFNMLRKNDGDGCRDQKYFVLFQAPADVRKMVFMVHKHAAEEKEDDRWLYMPGLDLVKRIAASDKRTSFVGSDFLYEDISGRSPSEDSHELVSVTDRFYIIKNIPKKPESVEFSYYLAYIDKSRFLPMKMEFFKTGERLYRVIETMQVEEIQSSENGREVTYPTVTASEARNLENGSVTKMTVSGVQYNIGLNDTVFSERYLRRPPREAMR